MDTYQGTCRYCGNEQPVMADSQDAADEEMSNTCRCGGASKEQKKAKFMERINYIAGGSYDGTFKHLNEDQTRMLRQGGRDIMEHNCTAITFDFADSKVKISYDGDKYKVSRTGTRKEVAEA